MKCQQSATKPDAEVHATWYHEQTTRRDKATALAISDAPMDGDRSVEMQDYHHVPCCRDLRRAGERTVSGLWDCMGELLSGFPGTECQNYFTHQGYCGSS